MNITDTTSAILSKFDDSELNVQFRLLADKLVSIGSKLGVEIFPYRDSSLPRFSALPAERKKMSLSALRVYLEVCDETVRDGKRLDSPQFVWFALQKLGLRPPSDLFEYMTDENVVEIHDLAGIQIFRNFMFYDYCSYTIEELYCEPWHGLYDHQESSLPLLHKFVGDVANGSLTGVRHLNLEHHTIKENFSKDKFILDAHMIYGSPLFDQADGQPSATLVVETANLVEAEVRPPVFEGPELSLV